jgi:toxin YxiD
LAKNLKNKFEVKKWAKDKHGKTFPVEWKAKNGSKVNIDDSHSMDGPDVPHIGYQSKGKHDRGGRVRGHVLVDEVPVCRENKK